MPGNRSARVVLPAPFGPVSITWWPPAAATSTAYLASAMPSTSIMSSSSSRDCPRQLSRLPEDSPATGGASGTGSSLSWAATCASDRMPNTTTPGTIAASRTWGSGTNTWRIPWRAAASTIGRTP